MQTVKKQTLAVSAGVHATQDGLTSTVYVLLPILAQSLGLSYAQVGTVRAVYSGMMWVLEIPAGILSERFGEQRLLVFGLITAGLGYGILSTVNSFYGVLFALLIAGTGAAFQHSLSSALISRVYDGPSRRVALGTYNASGDTGKLLFTGVASLLFGVGIAWQTVVSGYGILALLASAVLWLVLRRLRVKGAESIQARHPSTTASWGITDRPGFRWLAAIVFVDIAVQDGFLVFVAFLMIEKNMPAGLAAFAVSVSLVGAGWTLVRLEREARTVLALGIPTWVAQVIIPRIIELDEIAVKGKTEAVAVYEVLDYHNEETFPNVMEVLNHFKDGLEKYRGGKWDPATKAFKEALKLNPGDFVSTMYIERCAQLKADPPKKWDGVWVMTSK